MSEIKDGDITITPEVTEASNNSLEVAFKNEVGDTLAVFRARHGEGELPVDGLFDDLEQMPGS